MDIQVTSSSTVNSLRKVSHIMLTQGGNTVLFAGAVRVRLIP